MILRGRFRTQSDGWLGQRPRIPDVLRGVAPATLRALGALILLMAFSATTSAYDLHFDYTSFENSPGKHFQQAQFDVLNYPSINGNYMMTSTDNHRPEMVANGNALAEFYNNFNADYNHPTAERRTPTEEAAFINTYTLNNSTNNGPQAGLVDSQRDLVQPMAAESRRTQSKRTSNVGDRHGHPPERRLRLQGNHLFALRNRGDRQCPVLAGSGGKVVHRHRVLSERHGSVEQRHQLRVAPGLGTRQVPEFEKHLPGGRRPCIAPVCQRAFRQQRGHLRRQPGG